MPSVAILPARAERWQSGRMRRLAKAVSLHGFRGFESLPLRHYFSVGPRAAPGAEASMCDSSDDRGQVVRKADLGTGLARRCAVLATLLATAGCRGDRLLRIETVPQGATVRLDDRVIGRTPLEVDFEHYGQRRLSIYKETYRTYSEPLVLKAPWWARFPTDLLTEVILPLGLDDVREHRFVLVPDVGEIEATVATQEFMEHAMMARGGDTLEGVPIAGAKEDSEDAAGGTND